MLPILLGAANRPTGLQPAQRELPSTGREVRNHEYHGHSLHYAGVSSAYAASRQDVDNPTRPEKILAVNLGSHLFYPGIGNTATLLEHKRPSTVPRRFDDGQRQRCPRVRMTEAQRSAIDGDRPSHGRAAVELKLGISVQQSDVTIATT